MFVKPFRYERAQTLADAAAMLREADGSAKVLAGGQSLLPMMNLGVLDLEALIDVSHVEGARGVTCEDGYVSIGALTTHGELERDPAIASGQPLVAAAAGWIGSSRIRARGTLGGSLAHSDPAAELPLAMVVTGATYDLTNGEASRTVAATDFHESYFTTTLADRRAARADPRAGARPRVGMGLRGGVASPWRFRALRRRRPRARRGRPDRRVAPRPRRRWRAADATWRRRDRRGGGGRRRTRGPDRADRGPRARQRRERDGGASARTSRGFSRSGRSPMRSREGRPHERDRCDGHPHGERRADDPHDRRARLLVALAARRRRYHRSEVRLRRRGLRRLHGARRRRARERMHRARRAGRRRGDHDGRRPLRIGWLARAAATAVPRTPRGAVRLLHPGHAVVRPRDAPRRRRTDDARRHPGGAARQPLSLYRLHRHRGRDRGCAEPGITR